MQFYIQNVFKVHKKIQVYLVKGYFLVQYILLCSSAVQQFTKNHHTQMKPLPSTWNVSIYVFSIINLILLDLLCFLNSNSRLRIKTKIKYIFTYFLHTLKNSFKKLMWCKWYNSDLFITTVRVTILLDELECIRNGEDRHVEEIYSYKIYFSREDNT